MSEPYHSFIQVKNEIKNLTINKTNIMKKSKYQQYYHCFIVCMLVPYVSWFSC